jgi:hypothetical protein
MRNQTESIDVRLLLASRGVASASRRRWELLSHELGPRVGRPREGDDARADARAEGDASDEDGGSIIGRHRAREGGDDDDKRRILTLRDWQARGNEETSDDDARRSVRSIARARIDPSREVLSRASSETFRRARTAAREGRTSSRVRLI